LEFTYQSTDHSPGHPEKAYHIQSNGGVFRRVEDEKLIKAKIMQPPSDASQPLSPSSASRFSPYPSLLKARVCRPDGYQNSYGLPEDVSINLGDALGDLYFKLDPPLFQCEPDVEFIELEAGAEYLGILAPDGLWDHLRLKIPDMVRTIAKYLTEIENWHAEEPPPPEACLRGEVHSRPLRTKMISSEALNRLAGALCDRKSDELRIFERDQGRYDDCTIIVFAVRFGESTDGR
jgi:serine/threonine protein phosphatase PrpC